ncbi:MAG: hypothetical protein GY953_02585, partial [bacterium]|nr:hypothetical protein [bacterium]
VIADAEAGTGPLVARDVDSTGGGVDGRGVGYVADLYLRATATDASGAVAPGAVAGPFELGNDPPVASIGAFEADLSDTIVVLFTLLDAAADSAGVELQFRLSATDSWRALELSFGVTDGLLSSPTGIEHAVLWNSRAAPDAAMPDAPQGVGGARRTGVEIRVRAFDRPPDPDVTSPDTLHFGAWSTPTALPEIVNQLSDSGEARAIVISSTGRHFTAGLDLGLIGSGTGSAGKGEDAGRARANFRSKVLDFQQSMSSLEKARIPVLAAIQGGC